MRPQNPHLWNEGLRKAKSEMLNKLTRMRNANSDNWSSDSDNDQQMPPIRLSIEDGEFLDGLPGTQLRGRKIKHVLLPMLPYHEGLAHGD